MGKLQFKTMQDLIFIDQPNDYARSLGVDVWHPHVSIIHYDELGPISHALLKLGVFAVFVQDNFPENPTYGLGGYKIGEGALTAAAPGQIIGKADDGRRVEYHGWVLFFDKEFMHGTDFDKRLPDYHFFSYNVNEALLMTDNEKLTMYRLMEEIRTVLAAGDRNDLQDHIIQDYILLVCDYCRLFYQRQFAVDLVPQSDLLSRLMRVLNNYYEQRLHLSCGLPNVKYCASELCLSISYFGDVIRGLTGDSPTRIIHRFLVDRAKSLMVSGLTVSQVAVELGFEYPQHFTRFFKKHTGLQPSKYLASLKG